MSTPIVEAPQELQWGETPWDALSREELLREVWRMYAAIVRLQSVANLCMFREEGSPFWGRAGTGGSGLELARQILDPIHAQHSSEEIFRAFFRYAVDLLFEGNTLGTGWSVCDKCEQMIGGRLNDNHVYESAAGRPCKELLLNKDCTGILRSLQWEDLRPLAQA